MGLSKIIIEFLFTVLTLEVLFRFVPDSALPVLSSALVAESVINPICSVSICSSVLGTAVEGPSKQIQKCRREEFIKHFKQKLQNKANDYVELVERWSKYFPQKNRFE